MLAVTSDRVKVVRRVCEPGRLGKVNRHAAVGLRCGPAATGIDLGVGMAPV